MRTIFKKKLIFKEIKTIEYFPNANDMKRNSNQKKAPGFISYILSPKPFAMTVHSTS